MRLRIAQRGVEYGSRGHARWNAHTVAVVAQALPTHRRIDGDHEGVEALPAALSPPPNVRALALAAIAPRPETARRAVGRVEGWLVVEA